MIPDHNQPNHHTKGNNHIHLPSYTFDSISTTLYFELAFYLKESLKFLRDSLGEVRGIF